MTNNSCTVQDHSFVYIARSSADDNWTEPFMETYCCIECGKQEEIIHEPNQEY